jgi:uncharacterized protein
MGRLRLSLGVVGLVLVFAACDGGGGGSDGDSSSPARRPLNGFGEVGFRVSRDSEVVGEWCALMAETSQARSQGLMDQVDLRGYDAMVFRYDQPTTTGFYMFHTRIPLAIAWFDAEGGFVSSDEMEPCSSDDATACPRYFAEGPFLHALETQSGGLDRLGVGPRASLSFGGDGCDTG